MVIFVVIHVLYDWGPLRPEENAKKKPVALRYWYGAWRHGMSRQAIEF